MLRAKSVSVVEVPFEHCSDASASMSKKLGNLQDTPGEDL
jgi:hypothetical protein